jgi:hypothetical protein
VINTAKANARGAWSNADAMSIAFYNSIGVGNGRGHCDPVGLARQQPRR